MMRLGCFSKSFINYHSSFIEFGAGNLLSAVSFSFFSKKRKKDAAPIRASLQFIVKMNKLLC